MGDEGLEHAQQYSIFGDSNVCAALGAALDPNSGRFDPGLAFVIAAWPTLPEAVRADVLAMVRHAQASTPTATVASTTHRDIQSPAARRAESRDPLSRGSS